MKYIHTFLTVVSILSLGSCNENIAEPDPPVDENPARIVYFEAIANSSQLLLSISQIDSTFPIHSATYSIFPGDTVANTVRAIDRDSLRAYTVKLEGHTGTVGLLNPVDTLTAQFGFIADTALYKPGSMIKTSVTMHDVRGFTMPFDIYVYIKHR